MALLNTGKIGIGIEEAGIKCKQAGKTNLLDPLRNI